jgi:transcriptional regulator with XRE-family HTH domain
MRHASSLAEMVGAQRARLSLSLAAIARRMREAADQEGEHCGASRQTIHEIEQGRIPHPDALRWLAAALELPVAQLSAAARAQRMNRRQLLQTAGLMGGVMLLPGPTRSTPAAVEAGEVAGYLARVFTEFSTADWLLGPQLVLPAIPRHLDLVVQLLDGATGTDRRELLCVGARWAEFAAWVYADADHVGPAGRWADRAMAWATEADDQVMVAYTLVRKADQAAQRDDAAATIGLAQAAQRRTVPARVRAAALVHEAHGHAIASNQPATMRALDQAAILAARGEEGPGRYLTPGYVELQRAACWQTLGHPDKAIGAFERQLATLPAVHRRDRGLYLARLARAYRATGNRAQASAVAAEARAVADATGSKRILRGLAK